MTRETIMLFTVLAIALGACSASKPSQNSSQGSRALNPMSQLAVGTMKLDGTANAVTKAQAAQLIPMWQVYKQLTASDTAAQEEIDGLTRQIQDTMTADQRKAISDMELAQSDVFGFMQPQGGSPSTGNSGQSSRSTANQGGGFPGGDPGFGGPPPDMGGGAPGGTTGRQASGTQTGNSAQGGQTTRMPNANRVPTPLIEALIQYLQKTAAS